MQDKEKEAKKTTSKKTTTPKKSNSSQRKETKKVETKTAKSKTKEAKKTVKKVVKEIPIDKVEEVIADKIEKMEIKKDEVMETENPKLTFSLFEVILMIIITVLSCLLIFNFVQPKEPIKPNANDGEIADNKYTKMDIELFLDQYNYILENYYGDIDPQQLLKDAIEGMFSSLDGYSQVIGQDSNSFIITLEGQYEGVGISIYNDGLGNIIIDSIYEDTPASKAGLKPNDIIIKFNDKDLTNVSTSDLVDMIANANEMKLTVLRGSEQLEVTLKREKIVLKSVNYKMLEDNIGYIDIDIFASNTLEQFKEALATLENQKMKSLIIDLRDNTGGHLSIVEEMLYLFLNNDKIVYQTEDKNGVEKFYSKGNKNAKYEIVILQNNFSASASEIMAAGLSENLDAYIVGTNSYGKGTVQTLIDLSEDMQYKFTTKRWLTPNGNWIEGKGIKPDKEVYLPIDYYENPTEENDLQLKSAIEYLKN